MIRFLIWNAISSNRFGMDWRKCRQEDKKQAERSSPGVVTGQLNGREGF